MPEITVIIPVHNAQRYLNKCIESLVNQTYKNFEVILVDDGSSDGSDVICDSWAQRDARIRVLHQENRGVASARNAGLDMAAGKWLTFVDSDDYVESNLLELQVRAVNESGADACRCDYYVGNEQNEGNESASNELLNREDILKRLVLPLYGASKTDKSPGRGFSCGWLYSRELIAECRFEVKLSLLEDTCFNAAVLARAQSVLLINKKMYHYQVNDYSATMRVRDDIWEQAEVLYSVLLDIASKSHLLEADTEDRLRHTVGARCIAAIRAMGRNSVKTVDIANSIRHMLNHPALRPVFVATSRSLAVNLMSFLLQYRMIWMAAYYAKLLAYISRHNRRK